MKKQLPGTTAVIGVTLPSGDNRICLSTMYGVHDRGEAMMILRRGGPLGPLFTPRQAIRMGFQMIFTGFVAVLRQRRFRMKLRIIPVPANSPGKGVKP